MYNTNSKKILIELFENNKNQSYSAIYLIKHLKDKMNKATIYRQLKSLEDNEIIRKTFNDETRNYEYQYFNNCNNHFHLKCNSCGKIIHLNCKEAIYFVNHILDSHGFLINQYSSTLTGICKECA